MRTRHARDANVCDAASAHTAGGSGRDLCQGQSRFPQDENIPLSDSHWKNIKPNFNDFYLVDAKKEINESLLKLVLEKGKNHLIILITRL